MNNSKVEQSGGRKIEFCYLIGCSKCGWTVGGGGGWGGIVAVVLKEVFNDKDRRETHEKTLWLVLTASKAV